MGKNILILTHQYSSDAKPNGRWTKVVSYFAQEWAKENNVLVIINSTKFPKIYYFFGGIMRLIARFTSQDPALITDQDWRQPFDFNDGCIKVYNRPMLKFLPHGKYFKFQLNNQVKEIISILEENHFKPDIIDGHWLNPQLDLLISLGDFYKARTALVVHSEAITSRYYTRSNAKKLNELDKVGCRSHYGAKTLYEKLKLNKLPFVCSSGITDKYANTAVQNKTIFQLDQKKIVTIGRLMDWKCIDSAINGVDDALKGTDYQYSIMGDGPEMQSLQRLIDKRGISEKVKLLGRLPREQVIENLKDADIFVLISEHETFGLVYLEAMLQGCITIAAWEGGVDGIIEDGINGFLCRQDDSEDLADVIKRIVQLPQGKLQDISRKAQETALNYTDSKVAKRYLDIISQ